MIDSRMVIYGDSRSDDDMRCLYDSFSSLAQTKKNKPRRNFDTYNSIYVYIYKER